MFKIFVQDKLGLVQCSFLFMGVYFKILVLTPELAWVPELPIVFQLSNYSPKLTFFLFYYKVLHKQSR